MKPARLRRRLGAALALALFAAGQPTLVCGIHCLLCSTAAHATSHDPLAGSMAPCHSASLGGQTPLVTRVTTARLSTVAVALKVPQLPEAPERIDLAAPFSFSPEVESPPPRA